MADNSFGVTELNLIGSSGTPKIESPNNLNLNAVTVAISTNATVGGTATFGGDVDIADTIYHTGDSNTKIRFPANDTISLHTAGSERVSINPSGNVTLTGSVSVAGVSTFSGNIKNSSDSAGTYWGATDDLLIKHNGNDSVITHSNTGRLSIQNTVEGQTIEIEPKGNVEINRYGGAMYAEFKDGSSVDLYFSGSKKFETTNNGTVTTGISTATSFSGGGNDIVTSRWTLGANGSSDYTFTGPGGLSATNDPKIYLARGQTYEFVNNSGGSHPFQIQTSGGSAYNTGVTNNNASSGTIKFEVPFSAPNTLQYKCTNHSSMGNTIIVYPDLSP